MAAAGGDARGGALMHYTEDPSKQQATLVIGCTFAHNQAIGGRPMAGRRTDGNAEGGAIAVDNTVSLVVIDSLFTANTAECPSNNSAEAVFQPAVALGGAIAGCNVSAFDSSFIANTATNLGGQSFGGAFYASPQCSLQVHHSQFVANGVQGTAAAGGALYGPASSWLAVSECLFSHNRAVSRTHRGTAQGGAVYFGGDSGVVDNTNFTHNHAEAATVSLAAGGAVYSQGTLDVVSSMFLHNEAYAGGAFALSGTSNTTAIASRFEHQKAHLGGAVHFDCSTNSSSLLVASSVFIDNSATTASGGAILLEGRSRCQTTVFDSSFTGNTAAANGGAIALTGCIALSIHSTSFDSQTAAVYAGALSIESACDILHNVTQCSFATNTATVGGGGIALLAGFLHLDTCNITENSAGAGGGVAVHAKHNASCNCTIQETLFANNNATTSGGAISVDGYAAIDISKTVFSHQHAGMDGGAISVASTSSEVSLVSECALVQNRADGNGGGIALSNGALLVNSCNFTANHAQFGGGVYSSIDTTLSWQAGVCNNNSAVFAGGMVYIELAGQAPQMPAVDCDFHGNTAWFGYDVSSSPTELVVTFSSPLANPANWVIWPGQQVAVWAALHDWFHNTVVATTSFLQVNGTASSSVNLIVQYATVAPNSEGLYSVSNMSFLGYPTHHSAVGFSLTYATGQQLQFTDSVNVTLAFCPPGYFLELEGEASMPLCSKCSSTEYSFDGKAACKSCPHNGDESHTSCIESEWSNGFTLKPGYWPSPDVSRPDSLIVCPRRESCKQTDCWYNLTSSLDWDVHCSPPRCETGYTDRLCTRCECSQEDCWFSSSTEEFTCEKCRDLSTRSLAGLLVSLLVSVVLLLIVRNCAPLMLLAEAVLTIALLLLELESWLMFDIVLLLVLLYFLTRRQVSTGVVKSVLFYLQTFGAIGSVSAQLFPGWLIRLQQVLNVFNFHFSGLECFNATLFRSALGRTIFFLLLPVVLVVLVVLLITGRFLLGKLPPIKWMNKKLKHGTTCANPSQPSTLQAHDLINTLDNVPLITGSAEEHTNHVQKSTKLRYELRHSILFILFTVYFDVTNTALAVLQPCDSYGYMTEFPWIRCDWSGEYKWLIAVAAVAVCVYTVAIPALFIGLLIGKRRSIIGKDVHVHYWMGMLFEGYRLEVYWWEMVWLVRRLALSMVLNLVPASLEQVRLLLISLVLFVSLLTLSYVQPREQSMENYVEMASLVCLLLDTLAVQIVASSPSSNNLAFVQHAVLTWNVLIILSFVVSLFVPCCVASYKRRRRKRIASLTAL